MPWSNTEIDISGRTSIVVMELLLQGTQALLVRVVVKVVLKNSNAQGARNGM